MSRIVHAGGDSTRKVIVDTLVRKVKDQKNITIWEHAFVEDLITVENTCYGVVLVDERGRAFMQDYHSWG